MLAVSVAMRMLTCFADEEERSSSSRFPVSVRRRLRLRCPVTIEPLPVSRGEIFSRVMLIIG